MQRELDALMAALRSAVAVSLVVVLSACGGGGGGTSGDSSPPTPISPPVVNAPTATQITLQSDVGDIIGQGRSYAYTAANAQIDITVRSGLVSVAVTGDEDWQGDFKVPGTGTPQATAYEGALYYPASSSNQAALRWYGGGRGCATATGSFWIDHVALTSDGNVRSLILRFERRCNGGSAALRGEVRWLATDTTAPPPVAETGPDTLWRPAVGATPANGNFVHLVSDPGDIVGLGRTRTYTRANARMYGAGSPNFFDLPILPVAGLPGWVRAGGAPTCAAGW